MRRAAVLLLALVAALALAASASAARPKWDTRVFSRIPSPGFPALSYVAPDGRVYVGTYENPSGDKLYSRVLEFGPDGTLDRSWTIDDQDLNQPHGIQVVTQDPAGRLVLLDHNPARALLLDPRTGERKAYATFSDVPSCTTAAAGTPCSQTMTDNPAQPDYAAWGEDGSLYVTDYQQGLLWRVPPGGGKAEVWLSDPRLDGGQFGTAGIALLPDHHTLLVSQGSSESGVNGNPATGRLYKVPIQPDGKPGMMEQLWESGPAEAPDGFAVAQSGNVYMALVGPGTNQLVEIGPDGKELARFPSDKSGGNGSPVPFDEPSSAVFDGTRLMVTNLAYASGNTDHMVVFDVEAGEPGAPVFIPPAPASPLKPVAKKKRAKPRCHYRRRHGKRQRVCPKRHKRATTRR